MASIVRPCFFKGLHCPQTRMNADKKRVYQIDTPFLVGDGGFEPPKAKPADLQSVPFGHSGNLPYLINGAGGRT